MKYIIPSRNITNYISTIVPTLLILMAHLLFIADSAAQSRPYDNTEINVVNKGGLQSDSYFSNKQTTLNDQLNLNTLLRYGLTKNMELQFGWNSQKDRFNSINVTTDATRIGIKLHLTNDGSILPALSAIVSTNLTFDPDKTFFLPSLNLLFEKSIASSWNVNGNFQFQLNEDSGDLSTNYAFNIEADITNWQTTYIGLTGNSNEFKGENVPYQNYLEIGMLLYVYDGIVLYPFYDIGLNDSSGNIFSIGALFTLGK